MSLREARVEFLKEGLEMAQHNLCCYGNILGIMPKKGYESEWENEREKELQLKAWIQELELEPETMCAVKTEIQKQMLQEENGRLREYVVALETENISLENRNTALRDCLTKVKNLTAREVS